MIFQYYKKKLSELERSGIKFEGHTYIWYLSKYRKYQLVLEKYLEGYSKEQIKRELGISISNVLHIVRRFGAFHTRRHIGISKNVLIGVYIYHYLREFPFLSLKDMAKIFNVSYKIVWDLSTLIAQHIPEIKRQLDAQKSKTPFFKVLLDEKHSEKQSYFIMVEINGITVPVMTLKNALKIIGLRRGTFYDLVRLKYIPPSIVRINKRHYFTIYEIYVWLYAKLYLKPVYGRYKISRIGTAPGNNLAKFNKYLWNKYWYIKDCLKKGIRPIDIPYVVAFKDEQTLRSILSKIFLENQIVNPKLVDDIVKNLTLFQVR